MSDFKWGSAYKATAKGKIMHIYGPESPKSGKRKALCGYGTPPVYFAESQQFNKGLGNDCGECWLEYRKLLDE